MRGDRPNPGGQGHQQGSRLQQRRVRHILQPRPHHRLGLVLSRNRRVKRPDGHNFHRQGVHRARIGPVGRRGAHKATINFACLPATEDIGPHSCWGQNRLAARSGVSTLEASNTAQVRRTVRAPWLVVLRGARAAATAPHTIAAAPGARRISIAARRCRRRCSADGGPDGMVR